MNLKEFAHSQYRKYCLAEGSQHIVSEFALFQILHLVQKYKVRSVLEVGVGIGTISGSLIKYSREKNLNIKFTGTESNHFCLAQIPVNLGSDVSKLDLFSDVKALPQKRKFDLVIIDGGERNLQEIKNKIVPGGIVLIEGDRRAQVEIIKKIFPESKYAHFISLKKNGEYSVKRSQDFQGGLKLVFTKPKDRQLLHWIRIKAVTAIKFQTRKFIK